MSNWFISFLFVNCGGKICDVFEIRNTDFWDVKNVKEMEYINMYARKVNMKISGLKVHLFQVDRDKTQLDKISIKCDNRMY